MNIPISKKIKGRILGLWIIFFMIAITMQPLIENSQQAVIAIPKAVCKLKGNPKYGKFEFLETKLIKQLEVQYSTRERC